MADIPGIASIRLLIQQPVTMAPLGPKIELEKFYILEIGFPDGAAMNLPIGKSTYEELLKRMSEQPGVVIEQRVAAQGYVAGEKPMPRAPEKALPLNASQQDMLDTLAEVVTQPPEIHPRKLKP